MAVWREWFESRRDATLRYHGVMAVTVNQWEMRGRADKAQKLARWALAQGLTAEVVALWSDAQWDLAMKLAKINGRTPSTKTQGMVVGLLTPSPVHPSFYAGRHDPDGV
jgi:predicted amidophosphoribosyltransferase